MKSELWMRLYTQMLRVRLAEEKIAALYAEQEMRCPVHLCIGQEAVAAGVCAALLPQDYTMSAHRAHGHYLAAGGSLKAMMAELYGKVTGCCRGKGGSMHLIDLSAGFLGAVPIVGSTIAIGVGAAFGSALRGENRVTIIFFGEAATEEGVFHESINFAALHRLPVVFVCENNLYSVYSPLSVRQPEGLRVYEMARGHGVEAQQADGNDVVEVHRLASSAVSKAREGGGPTLLEFMTYRWREHCGPSFDNSLGYREEQEFLEWQKRCPLDRMRGRLLSEQICTEDDLESVRQCIEDEVEASVAFAKSSPFPEAECAGELVYAE